MPRDEKIKNSSIDNEYDKIGRVVPHLEKEDPLKDIDMINHPPHYTFTKPEVLDVLLTWFPTDPLLFITTQYLARANRKGHKLEDLKKAKFYLDRAIEIEYKDRLIQEAQLKNTTGAINYNQNMQRGWLDQY